jgi:phosphoglycerol transferase MdoB-like AlkP superfamily enzyme
LHPANCRRERYKRRQQEQIYNRFGFKSKGYNVGFLYGGYSYFDNMKSFFGNNGYQIVDRDSFLPQEVSFANVWGVCDEDMAKKAIVMNAEAKSGNRFLTIG